MNKQALHSSCYADFLDINELRKIQLFRLQQTVKNAYKNVKLFHQRMNAENISPDDINSLKDISKLPFTEKTDLRDTYPYGLFARPLEEIVRLHASSGTTGKPIVVGYTKNDMEVWKEVVLRTFKMAGVTENDVIQNAYGYGLFTGGLGVHYGAEKLGATVVPISGGNSERQVMVMKDFKVSVVCSTPSYFIHLIEEVKKRGISFDELSLKAGFFGAEPWTEGMRQYIERETGIVAIDIYGLSEIIGPGVASECRAQNGLHIFEDRFYPEIVDPKTGIPLPDGEEGELVLTTLSKEAMPMIRYRTHDLSVIMNEPCECGRTIRRIRRIKARSDDMMIIRGVNVFPSQIETALLTIKEALPHYEIELTNKNGLDQIEVKVEITADLFGDRISEIESIRRNMSEAIHHIIGIRVKLTLVQPGTITRSQGKAKRVIDLREKK